MPRKPSEAVIKSARLNPINAQEKDALEIIEELEAQGYSFKEIVVDAILRADGRTPEMYPPNTQNTATVILGQLEQMFAQFAQEIISQVKRGGGQPVQDDTEEDADGRPSPFAKSFAKSYVERQRRALGDK